MNTKKMNILFCSCDKYKDLWDPFFTIFYNRWKDCKYKIIINTESEKYSFPGLDIKTFSLYKKGQNISYGKRMIDHLNLIDTPYVMIILDDFFLRKDVDPHKIENLINYMEKNDSIDCIRLTPYQHREAYEKCRPLNSLPGFYQIPLCAGYKLNFQVCLWRTKSLLKYWKEEDDPWRWEVFANILSFTNEGFLIVGEKEGPILDYGYKVNGQPLSDVYRGKWVMENDLKQLFDENGVVVNFNERGIYSPESEQKHFNNLKTLRYVIQRIGISDTITLFRYLFVNKIKQINKKKYNLPNEYPIAFIEKKQKEYLRRLNKS